MFSRKIIGPYTLILLLLMVTSSFVAPAFGDCLQDGRKAWNNNQIDKAIKYFTKCINSTFIYKPKKGSAHAYRGHLYSTKGMYDKAFEDYEMSLKLQPSRHEALLYRGLTYIDTQQYDKAIDDFTIVIEIRGWDKGDAEAYNNRGVAYAKKGEIEKARQDYQRAVELNPESELYRNNLDGLPVQKTIAPEQTAPAQSVNPATDTIPPEIFLERGIKVASVARHKIRGQARDASGVAIVEINGREASLDTNGNFTGSVLLKPGENEIIIQATDIYENVGTKIITMERSKVVADTSIPQDPEPLRTGKYYALLIAIEQYQHPSINDLSQPVKDARCLKKELESRYTFDSDNILLLTNATRAEIIDAFETINRRITSNDSLLIFYAGHGFWDKGFNQGYWLPSDTREGSKAAWLSNSTIRDYIRGIATKHTLLISDACFAGGIFKTRTAFNDASPAIQTLFELPSRKAITSGTLTEVPDKSVFIEYLIKRLAENENKYISSERLFSRFKDAVINNSPTRQVPQFGEIRESGDEGGDFIFVRR